MKTGMYGFKCRKCESEKTPVEWEVYGITPEEAEDVFCPECRSDEVEIMVFDATEDSVWGWMAKELREIRVMLQAIRDHLGIEYPGAGRSKPH